MTFRGTIENGRLVLDDGARLPDGTRVEVSLRGAVRSRKTKNVATDSLLRLADHAVNTGIRDLAAEHDHYLYGTPKRSRSKASRAKTPKTLPPNAKPPNAKPKPVRKRGSR